jgi:deoxyribonuclease V
MKPVIRHPWKVSVEEGCRIQNRLRRKIQLQNGFRQVSTIAGVDMAFDGRRGFGAVSVFTFPDLQMIEEVTSEKNLDFPYIPGLLSFREGPVLVSTLEKVRIEPDLLLFDGQGIAHPRGLGIASHMGLLFDKPAIGCAKSRLVGEYREPGVRKGSVSPLLLNQVRIGSVVRTRRNVKPILVSPGHHVDFITSEEIVLKCCKQYRLPEPIRWADRASRIFKNTYKA